MKNAMTIISVNVSLPREVEWKGHEVSTGIFKEPVQGPVFLRRLNLDGDRQADLKVHGGRAKAVYAYPSEHYPFWKNELGRAELPWGMFGENFTAEGWMEEQTHVGDEFRIGQAIVVVTQPRRPCYKLGIKFGRDDMIKHFLRSGRSGFYMSVVEEGLVEAGDTVEPVHEDEQRVSVTDLNRLYVQGNFDSALVERALRVKVLPDGWRDYLTSEFHAREL